MRIYTVQELSGASADGEGFVFVKEGFCWPGFFFPLPWMLIRKLWLVAGLYVLAAALLAALIELVGFGQHVALIGSFALQLLIGLQGNDLLCWTLSRRGYVMITLVSGRSLTEAEHNFFSRHGTPYIPSASGATPYKSIWPRRLCLPTTDHDRVFGLFPKAGG